MGDVEYAAQVGRGLNDARKNVSEVAAKIITM